ncbi:MAG: hypothetical protein LBD79_00175 [Treponema sp.]|nr:hypothetical protein [Treponema sp.]
MSKLLSYDISRVSQDYLKIQNYETFMKLLDNLSFEISGSSKTALVGKTVQANRPSSNCSQNLYKVRAPEPSLRYDKRCGTADCQLDREIIADCYCTVAVGTKYGLPPPMKC